MPFLKNINAEISSNHKKDVATMMAAVLKLSDEVTHYASHILRENVQFSAIEKIMKSMKTDQSFIYMIP